ATGRGEARPVPTAFHGAPGTGPAREVPGPGSAGPALQHWGEVRSAECATGPGTGRCGPRPHPGPVGGTARPARLVGVVSAADRNSMSTLIGIIESADPAIRNRPLAGACRALDDAALLAERDALDLYRRQSKNLYDRVRALFFLYAINRFH